MSRFLSTSLIVAISLLVGCSSTPDGQRPVAKTEVTVNYKGKPVEGATITFVASDDKHPAFGITDANGKAWITTYTPGDGAIVTAHMVSITKMQLDPKGNREVKDQEDPEYDPTAPPNMAPPKNMLPNKYQLVTTSGLKAEIKQIDKNEVTFDLDD
ncbi:MAG: hypothetical protein KDB03_03720 [Planctomycetales bacterium]|nr:hypothetical protein [Planctomycetales bacterium]